MTPDGDERQRGWTMWWAVWLATSAVSMLAIVGAWEVASETFELSLQAELEARLVSEAGMAAIVLETVSSEATGQREADIEVLRALRDATDLRELALWGPDGAFLSTADGAWGSPAAHGASLERARGDGATTRTMSSARDGERVLAAYVPVAARPGWVLGATTSEAPLGVSEDMEGMLGTGGLVVWFVSAVVGGLLAAAVLGPLGRLARDLGGVRPGDPADAVSLQGPREVRSVAAAARALLGAVRERDDALRAAHEREVHQVAALASAVAHEVRNPLNAMGLAVSRLERADDERAAALRAQLHALIADVDAIVERFMDLARPPVAEVREVPATALWDGLSVDAESLGVRLVTPDTAGRVCTDPRLVREALRNLVRNAAEAGATTVRVRVVGDHPMVLEISDDGPGIEPGDAERLFAWFHTTRAQGSGLGLPASRRALAALGGGLELVEPGRARFLATVEGGVA